MDVVSSNPAQELVVCGYCGGSMPQGAAYCPGCGRSMRPLPPLERMAATVAYLTFLPGAVLLLLPAFRHSRFVRFHAWQSVFLWVVFLLGTVLALFLSNVAAAVVFLLVGILASLAMFFLWAVLSFKAWQGERFELPLFGKLAAHLS
jgi:uncharacterized membrane protein